MRGKLVTKQERRPRWLEERKAAKILNERSRTSSDNENCAADSLIEVAHPTSSDQDNVRNATQPRHARLEEIMSW